MSGVAGLSPSSTTCSRRFISAIGCSTSRPGSSLISWVRRSVPRWLSGSSFTYELARYLIDQFPAGGQRKPPRARRTSLGSPSIATPAEGGAYDTREAQVRELAQSSAEAWCSRDPQRVAAHFVPGGTIAVNGGEPAGVTEVAQSFISEFPDIEVFTDDVGFGAEPVG